jgi:formate--tetrahydrofolate ligase
VQAVTDGCANLGRHIENMKNFGVPVVVAINHFVTDTDAEVQAVKDYVQVAGRRSDSVQALGQGLRRHRGAGDQGGRIAESGAAAFKPLYPDEMPCSRRSRPSPRRIYRADEVTLTKSDRDQLKQWEEAGLRQPAGLHGQDAVFLHHRSEQARRATGPHPGARSAAVCRCRLRRRDLR